MERVYTSAADILDTIAELRVENVVLAKRLEEGVYVNDDDAPEVVADVVFDNVIAMADVLATIPRPFQIVAGTYTGDIELVCGNINPHLMYHDNGGVDNGLGGYVNMSVGEYDYAIINAIHGEGHVCDKHDARCSQTQFGYAAHTKSEIARAFADTVAHFVTDRTPYTKETWQQQYEAQRDKRE